MVVVMTAPGITAAEVLLLAWNMDVLSDAAAAPLSAPGAADDDIDVRDVVVDELRAADRALARTVGIDCELEAEALLPEDEDAAAASAVPLVMANWAE